MSRCSLLGLMSTSAGTSSGKNPAPVCNQCACYYTKHDRMRGLGLESCLFNI